MLEIEHLFTEYEQNTIEIVCRNYSIDREIVLSNTRARIASEPRQIIMVLLVAYHGKTLKAATDPFAFHHSTYCKALRTVHNLSESCRIYSRRLEQILTDLHLSEEMRAEFYAKLKQTGRATKRKTGKSLKPKSKQTVVTLWTTRRQPKITMNFVLTEPLSKWT